MKAAPYIAGCVAAWVGWLIMSWLNDNMPTAANVLTLTLALVVVCLYVYKAFIK